MREPAKQHYWYIDNPMGVNYIGSLFKKAIELSGVDIGEKKISGTSARKNLAQTEVAQSNGHCWMWQTILSSRNPNMMTKLIQIFKLIVH